MIINTDFIYPIGAIYISTISTDPGNLFGGTWERIKDVFLLAAGDTYSAGSTGGEATHKLIESELPNITASYQIHGQEGGTIFYNLYGKATGTLMSNNYKTTQGGSLSGAKSYTTPGISFGGNQSHNNMPPYLTVYAWKRVS